MTAAEYIAAGAWDGNRDAFVPYGRPARGADSAIGRALARLSSPGRRIDILLTDLTMPGMSGRALTERARKIDPELRVICMSGHAERAATTGEHAVPCADYIQKPFSLDTLERLMRTTLDTPAA
jgi:DNA-binding NtrC family response regulator